MEHCEKRGARIIILGSDDVRSSGFVMNWRFLVADNASVDRFIVRDIDSRCVALNVAALLVPVHKSTIFRLLLRDRYAIDEWEASGLPYHVVRDHPGQLSHPVSGRCWLACSILCQESTTSLFCRRHVGWDQRRRAPSHNERVVTGAFPE